MFKRFPEQSRDRKHSFYIGVVSVIVCPLCFLNGWVATGFTFALLTLFFLVPLVFCGHAGLEKMTRIWSFFVGF